jgi:hypothetical protein
MMNYRNGDRATGVRGISRPADPEAGRSARVERLKRRPASPLPEVCHDCPPEDPLWFQSWKTQNYAPSRGLARERPGRVRTDSLRQHVPM